MASIVTVYSAERRKFAPSDMANIRWLKISEALSWLGHQVDIATNETFNRWPGKFPIQMGMGLRRVHLADVEWHRYDAVKTLFHAGFETLEAFGGADHPFIISKLGSVVGPENREGIHFHGRIRERLYATQTRIDQTSKYITVLTVPAGELWRQCFGRDDHLLLVPGGVDREIPPRAKDPFPDKKTKRCIFAGNVYNKRTQPEANAVLLQKLNALGKELSAHGVRVYLLGPGDVSGLNRECVNYLGTVAYEEAWNYFHFADVGIVVSAGNCMHNNESSKIYHYLRAGLPVVSEAGFPNDHVVLESKLGFVVENGNPELMAGKILEALDTDWNRDYAIRYILANHTWDRRVEIYDRLLKAHFA